MSRRKGDLSGRQAAKQLQRIYLRDQGICQLCNLFCIREEASRDHVVELCQGGSNEDSNIVLAHKKCNEDKSRTSGMVVKQHTLPEEEWWPFIIKKEISACLRRQKIGAPVTARTPKRFMMDPDFKDMFCELDSMLME